MEAARSKICSQCFVERPIEEFYPRKSGLTGRRMGHCHTCNAYKIGVWREKYPERNRATVARWAVNNPEKALFMRAKRHALVSGREFTITLADIVIPERCPILGLPLSLERKGDTADRSPSPDRINSNFGYIPGNVHVISWRANNLKGDATLLELMLLGAWAHGVPTKC